MMNEATIHTSHFYGLIHWHFLQQVKFTITKCRFVNAYQLYARLVWYLLAVIVWLHDGMLLSASDSATG